MGRIREAWVVWRYGAHCLAEQSAASAGPLEVEDPERLRRATARYERHAMARPIGFPAGGLGALAQIARVADQRAARPQTLHYAIRVLDQLSRRMRASQTADDSQRRDRQAGRARRRHTPDPASPFAFRTALWPNWVTLDEHGDPLLINGDLQTRELPGVAGAPDRDDPMYVQTLRDAHLLAGLWAPLHADGRATMALGDERDDDGQRRARPGPYQPPPDRHPRADPADHELARLAGIALQEAKRVQVDVRDRLLEQLRAQRALEHEQQRTELWQRIETITQQAAAHTPR